MSTPFKRTVEAGYDHIANQYLASKDPEDPATLAALEELAGELAPGAPVRWGLVSRNVVALGGKARLIGSPRPSARAV